MVKPILLLKTQYSRNFLRQDAIQVEVSQLCNLSQVGGLCHLKCTRTRWGYFISRFLHLQVLGTDSPKVAWNACLQNDLDIPK